MLRNISFLLLAAALVLPATAQEHDNSVYLTALTADFNSASEKLNSLAEAIPEDHFDWSPAEGVRSVAGVLNHVADANFAIASALGHESTYEGTDTDTKEGATARLSASQSHVLELLESLAEADLSTAVALFGGSMDHYSALGIITGHTHEHLGQLIAYARSNGVAPPWSGG